jgi:hypothetical protein
VQSPVFFAEYPLEQGIALRFRRTIIRLRSTGWQRRDGDGRRGHCAQTKTAYTTYEAARTAAAHVRCSSPFVGVSGAIQRQAARKPTVVGVVVKIVVTDARRAEPGLVVGGDDGASVDFAVVQQLVGLARAVEREVLDEHADLGGLR